MIVFYMMHIATFLKHCFEDIYEFHQNDWITSYHQFVWYSKSLLFVDLAFFIVWHFCMYQNLSKHCWNYLNINNNLHKRICLWKMRVKMTNETILLIGQWEYFIICWTNQRGCKKNYLHVQVCSATVSKPFHNWLTKLTYCDMNQSEKPLDTNSTQGVIRWRCLMKWNRNIKKSFINIFFSIFFTF